MIHYPVGVPAIFLNVETEVLVRVVKGDIGDEFGEGFEVIGKFAFFSLVSNEVAEDTTEIFVAWEGEEGT